MTYIYIDESGSFDGLFLMGAHVTFDPRDLPRLVQAFEDEIYSKVEYEMFLPEYEQQGIHACENHPTIKNLFLSFWKQAAGRYVFAFKRRGPSRGILKQEYAEIASRLLKTLILQSSKHDEQTYIVYEAAEVYLSQSKEDEALLRDTLQTICSTENLNIKGEQKSFKELAFVDYACNIVYRVLRAFLEPESSESNKLGKFDLASYQLVEQKIIYIWDIDKKKRLEPRKARSEVRSLENWLKLV